MPTKKSQSKSPLPALKETNAKLGRENKELPRKLQARDRDLTESLEQQSATGDIIRILARGPPDLQSVMDSIAENAARLYDAKDAVIFRVDGDLYQRVAVYGAMPTTAVGMGSITRGTPVGRAVIDRETIHVHDIAAELESEFPEYRTIQQAAGTRTTLSTPLLHQGAALGVIHVRRTEVRPFTDKQIKLLEGFSLVWHTRSFSRS